MTKRIRPGEDDPLGFLQRMATYHRVEIKRKIRRGAWQRGLEVLAEDLEDNFNGHFVVLLTREADFTDNHAWYAVLCEREDDAEFVSRILAD